MHPAQLQLRDNRMTTRRTAQEVMTGAHTRVRVDAAVMPASPPLVSPQGKGKKKAAPMRQMGLGNFYKGEN